MGKIFNIKKLSLSILLVVVFLSIGYSAFDASLVFEDVTANIRAEANIRVTGISVDSGTSGVLAEGENYDVNGILTKFTLPDKTSSITYKIKITNFGAQEMGIFQITGLPDYLDYTISNYTLKDKICDKNNKCSLGIVKDDILLTIKYKDQTVNPTITNHNININFDFRAIYKITYTGITNNGYPTGIMDGETLKIKFINPIPYNVVAYINGIKDYNKYTYENGTLTIDNVTGNVEVEYVTKVYLKTLSQGTDFKESTYLTSIKTVQFVDYIDVPGDRIAIYDLSKNTDGSIIGWIDKNYNLYIGADWKIYGQNLSYAFYNMSGVTSITFDNLDTSEATTISHMFDGCSSLTSLDLSSFNTSKVTNMIYMFHGCSSLTSLDLSSFNTSKVEYMYAMFKGCSSLISLNLDNWNTSNVLQLQEMFYGCSSLTSLDLSSFNVAKASNAHSVFYNCSSLTSLDLSGWYIPAQTNMTSFLYGCSSLMSVDFRNANFSNATGYWNAFYKVPTNCNITVKDSAQKTWLIGKFSTLTNINPIN